MQLDRAYQTSGTRRFSTIPTRSLPCLQKVAAQLDPLSEEGHKEVLNYMRFAEHHLRLKPDSFAGWEHLAREHIQAC